MGSTPLIDYSLRLDQRYWCDRNGLFLLEKALRRLEELAAWSGAVPADYRMEVTKAKSELEWFIGNELYEAGDNMP